MTDRLAEEERLEEARAGVPWRRWGPYLSERQWGTVREDCSENGEVKRHDATPGAPQLALPPLRLELVRRPQPPMRAARKGRRPSSAVRPSAAAGTSPSTPCRSRFARLLHLCGAGEALGLHKEDLDARGWTLAVRRSWTEPLPKDGDARDVVVVSELRPHLLAAIGASPSNLVFPAQTARPTCRTRAGSSSTSSAAR